MLAVSASPRMRLLGSGVLGFGCVVSDLVTGNGHLLSSALRQLLRVSYQLLSSTLNAKTASGRAEVRRGVGVESANCSEGRGATGGVHS